jgi:hypothetical protein
MCIHRLPVRDHIPGGGNKITHDVENSLQLRATQGHGSVQAGACDMKVDDVEDTGSEAERVRCLQGLSDIVTSLKKITSETKIRGKS